MGERDRARSADAPHTHSDSGTDMDYADLIGRPGYFIRRLHQISVGIFISKTREFDVTPVQMGSIQVVESLPGIDQASLGRILALDRQTICNVVQRLCDKGLLERRGRGGRARALYTTGAARALLCAVREPLDEIDEVLLMPLSPDERAEFTRMLRKLVTDNNELSRAPASI